MKDVKVEGGDTMRYLKQQLALVWQWLPFLPYTGTYGTCQGLSSLLLDQLAYIALSCKCFTCTSYP